MSTIISVCELFHASVEMLLTVSADRWTQRLEVKPRGTLEPTIWLDGFQNVARLDGRIFRVRYLTASGQAQVYTGILDNSTKVCDYLFLWAHRSGAHALCSLPGGPQKHPAHYHWRRHKPKQESTYKFSHFDLCRRWSRVLNAEAESTSSSVVTFASSQSIAAPGVFSRC